MTDTSRFLQIEGLLYNQLGIKSIPDDANSVYALRPLRARSTAMELVKLSESNNADTNDVIENLQAKIASLESTVNSLYAICTSLQERVKALEDNSSTVTGIGIEAIP